MRDLYAFEPQARSSRGAGKGERAERLIDLTRRALLAQSALIEYRATGDPTVVYSAADEAVAAFDRAIAEPSKASQTASRTSDTQNRSICAHRSQRCRYVALPGARAQTYSTARVVLCETLIERIEALQRATTQSKQASEPAVAIQTRAD